MTFRMALAGTALALASSAVNAGELVGNVGAVSTYMFRGVDQSSGAAVQGGVDYGFESGVYTGVWISNSLAGGGNEADVYAGYGLDFAGFTLDAGVIYYAYTEDTENGLPNRDYGEVYLGAGWHGFAAKLFYTPEFGGDTPAGSGAANGSGDLGKNDLLYATASYTLTFGETVALSPQLGFTSGDGAKDRFGDEYLDYSLTAVKKLDDGLSVSLAAIGTDREDSTGNKDNPKLVVGLRKTFDI